MVPLHKSIAIAAPMPEDAPVIQTTLSWNVSLAGDGRRYKKKSASIIEISPITTTNMAERSITFISMSDIVFYG